MFRRYGVCRRLRQNEERYCGTPSPRRYKPGPKQRRRFSNFEPITQSEVVGATISDEYLANETRKVFYECNYERSN